MKVTDGVGCFGAASVFLFGSVWIPFLGPLLGLLTPLPFLFYGSKLGIREGLKVSSVSLALLSLLSYGLGYPQILFLAAEFCFMGLTLSELFRRRFTIGHTVLWGTTSLLLMGFTVLALLGWSRDKGPLELVQAYIRESLNEAAAVYRHMGAEEAGSLEFHRYLEILTDVILKIYAGLLISGTAFVVWLNVMISRPLFRAAGIEYPVFGPLEEWQAPEPLVWGVIASGFSLFLPEGIVQSLAMNALIVLAAIYVFQGLSVLLFFLRKYRIPLWVRIGVYSLIIFQQIFVLALALAGLFDQWIDFRRIHAGKATQ